MLNRFEWIPLVSVGPVKFGDNIEDHLRSGFAIEDKFDEDPEEPDYIDRDDVLSFRVGEDSVTVESIHTWESLVYKGRNLIGMNQESLLKHLGAEPDSVEKEEEPTDEVIETILSFDRLGLLVWLRKSMVHAVAVDEGD